MATLESIQSELSELRSEIKSLTKLVRKIKSSQDDPTGEKAKSRAKNNGFNRPLTVSQELRTFLELADGENISRSDVTRRINKYVTENGLKHPDNGRIIILDQKLTDLLKPPAGLQITFLNVQKYLSPHYVKVEEVPPEAPGAAPEPATTKAKVAVKRPTVKKSVQ
jgi:upstream activation factor subunit UAF30